MQGRKRKMVGEVVNVNAGHMQGLKRMQEYMPWKLYCMQKMILFSGKEGIFTNIKLILKIDMLRSLEREYIL